MTAELEIEGLEDLQHQLDDVMPREAKRILRRTVTGVAAAVRDDMRSTAPVDEGTLKKAIKSRRRRGAKDSVEAAVYITHGTGVRHSAWYWHFVEFGTLKRPAHPYILPAVERWKGKISHTFRQEFGVQLEKEMAKRAKRADK